MKSCSILISNYNSWEAIQLCIESVRKYTKYLHKVTVYDDYSTNQVDRIYLTEAWKKGWLYPIFGVGRLNHGGAINKLLTNCDTELAMILDNDIQIFESGWLEEMVKLVDDKTLIIGGIETNYKSGKPSYPDWFQTWFMMINMVAYRDRMEVDWSRAEEKGIMIPVGAKLHIKLKEDNPKGYKFLTPIPESIQRKYHHFAHVSCIATESKDDAPWLISARENKLADIRQELAKLRSQ